MNSLLAHSFVLFIYCYCIFGNDSDSASEVKSEKNMCAQTSVTEIDRQPWWTVDLEKNYSVSIIDIATGEFDDMTEMEKYFNSHAIKVSSDAEGSSGRYCDGKKRYHFSKGIASIVCEEPIVGQYVTIEKLKPCEGRYQDCPLTNLPLHLCEVKVLGYDDDKSKILKNLAIGSSVNLNYGHVSQDGTVKLEPTSQCSIYVNYNSNPEWSVSFLFAIRIESVIIYTNESVVNMAVSVRNNEFEEDAECVSSEHNSNMIVFTCDSWGRTVEVKLKNPGSLVLCEVQIFTDDDSEKNKNLAIGKPTNQSSTEYNAISNLAVDGKTTTYFYPGRWIAQCTHTKEEGDKFPWWRVDLLENYVVNKLHVYNRGESLHSRLHDVEIRIGEFDIADYATTTNYRFRKNPLCFSNPKAYMSSGLNVITCQQELIGRYVSFQIVRLCTVSGCHWTARERNMLTLCEVEVYGQNIVEERLEEQNIAVNKPIQHSLDEIKEVKLNATGHTIQTEDAHPWLLIDLPTKSVVNKVVFVMESEGPGKVPECDIRVGNDKIGYDYNSKLFKQNVICYHMSNEFLRQGKNDFNCYQPLVGEYVSAQVTEKCTTDSCAAKYDTILSVTNVEVWGYSFEKVKFSTLVNVASKGSIAKKSEKQIGASALAVDGIIPKSIFKSIGSCHEKAVEYQKPWYNINLRKLSLVMSVKVHIPSYEDDLEGHAMQVSVSVNGPNIYDTENEVCNNFEKKAHLDVHDMISCQHPLVGNTVSVGIVHNKLHQVFRLCNVEVWGVELDDLSAGKSTIQSSTEKEAVSSLANDNMAPHVKIPHVYSQSCSENSETSCFVDTSLLRSCRDAYESGCKGSGVYVLSYIDEQTFERIFFNAYCDMETHGGGWNVIQRRNTALLDRVNFTRSWEDYKDGFGNLCGEMWLGNDIIHGLGTGDLRIELIVGDKTEVLEVRNFHISDEDANYTAYEEESSEHSYNDDKLGVYYPFQTYDRHYPNVEIASGGWWIGEETSINLNGVNPTLSDAEESQINMSELKLRVKSH